MSVKYLSQAWLNTPDLTGNHLLVLLALADWANDDGLCWPSVPKIATKARVCERTARYILRDLEARGYIEVHQERGLHHTNHYTLHLPDGPTDGLTDQPHPQNLQKGQSMQVLEPSQSTPPPPENLQKGQTLQVFEPFTSVQNLQTPAQNLQNGAAKPAIAVAPKPSLINHQLNRQYSSNPSSNGKAAPEEKRDLPVRSSPSPPSSAPPPVPVPGKPTRPVAPDIQSGSSSPVALLPHSNNIASVVSDYSHELGDAGHLIQNINQALRLWSHSGLSEQSFGQLLHDARLATRKHQTRPLSDTMRNKMAYFFAVLRDMVYRPPPTPPMSEPDQ